VSSTKENIDYHPPVTAPNLTITGLQNSIPQPLLLCQHPPTPFPQQRYIKSTHPPNPQTSKLLRETNRVPFYPRDFPIILTTPPIFIFF